MPEDFRNFRRGPMSPQHDKLTQNCKTVTVLMKAKGSRATTWGQRHTWGVARSGGQLAESSAAWWVGGPAPYSPGVAAEWEGVWISGALVFESSGRLQLVCSEGRTLGLRLLPLCFWPIDRKACRQPSCLRHSMHARSGEGG